MRVLGLTDPRDFIFLVDVIVPETDRAGVCNQPARRERNSVSIPLTPCPAVLHPDVLDAGFHGGRLES